MNRDYRFADWYIGQSEMVFRFFKSKGNVITVHLNDYKRRNGYSSIIKPI